MDPFTLEKIEFNAVRDILAEFCACSLGKNLAHRITPSRNLKTVRHWLEQTSQMVDAIREVGLPPFGGITDISHTLDQAKPSGTASGEDYARIASTLEGAANVRHYLLQQAEPLGCLHELAGEIRDFSGEIKAIRAIVAPDGDLYDDASPKLSSVRQEIAETTRRIYEIIHHYLRQPEVTRLLQEPTVTLHGDRYVLPVKQTNRGRLPGVVHRESNTGATVFVEPNASVELNNHLSDLRDDERGEIQRLLSQLAVRIQGRREEIEETLHALARVDLISAKAQYSYQFEMSAPEVTEGRHLQFIQARHPLLVDQAWRKERAGQGEPYRHKVVPIDVRLGSDFDLLVITGSNTGGKTVALKTVALLVVMVQAGMHIPARRGAILPLFQNVFIDIGDEQSLQQSLSTFGGHIKRLKHILLSADNQSLVLLDELGAGTDPDEGGAIGQAVLDELQRLGCLGMITTHLSVLKAYAFNHDRVDNASVEFDTKTLSPTYRLCIGTPGESHAITVAKRLGLPRRVTGPARQYLPAQGKQFEKAIRATGQARQVAELARQEALDAHHEAIDAQQAYQAKLADVKKLQTEFSTWLAKLSEAKPGDPIYVPTLKKTATLVRMEFHAQRALVDLGTMQMEVPLRDLMPDLGQQQIRQQMAELQDLLRKQAQQSQLVQAELEEMKAEQKRSLAHQQQRAKQFDQWLSSIARVKIGDEVSIARKPGFGRVMQIDLPALRAVVKIGQEEETISLQDLFPQTGPFSPHADQLRREHQKKQQEQEANRPIKHHHPRSKTAQKNRRTILNTPPGEQVFVVPFNKNATLVRLEEAKGKAFVQSGVFEIEVALSDLEPLHSQSGHRTSGPPHPKK